MTALEALSVAVHPHLVVKDDIAAGQLIKEEAEGSETLEGAWAGTLGAHAEHRAGLL